MARERAIDLTAVVEEARPVQGRVPSPRFPSWEELGLQGTPSAAAAHEVAAAMPRRRDLRAGWPAEHEDVVLDDRDPSGSYDDDSYDSYGAYGGGYRSSGETSLEEHRWDEEARLPHELPQRAPARLAVDSQAFRELEDLDEAPRRQRPPVMTWLLVLAALVLTGMVGYLLGASSQAADLTAARTAATTAQQARASAEQQLSAAQQAQAGAEAAVASAQETTSAAREAAAQLADGADGVEATGRSGAASAVASASASAKAPAQPATADAAGSPSLTGAGDASGSSSGAGAGSGSASGAGPDAGSAAEGGDSGSTGADPAAPAADPAG